MTKHRLALLRVRQTERTLQYLARHSALLAPCLFDLYPVKVQGLTLTQPFHHRDGFIAQHFPLLALLYSGNHVLPHFVKWQHSGFAVPGKAQHHAAIIIQLDHLAIVAFTQHLSAEGLRHDTRLGEYAFTPLTGDPITLMQLQIQGFSDAREIISSKTFIDQRLHSLIKVTGHLVQSDLACQLFAHVIQRWLSKICHLDQVQTVIGFDNTGDLAWSQTKSGIIESIAKETTADNPQIATLFSRGRVIGIFKCQCIKGVTFSKPLTHFLQQLDSFLAITLAIEVDHDM